MSRWSSPTPGGRTYVHCRPPSYRRPPGRCWVPGAPMARRNPSRKRPDRMRTARGGSGVDPSAICKAQKKLRSIMRFRCTGPTLA
ncbi:hypothetical protein DF17_17960 [Streptomyces rimosus]|nr:hypothetical protein DF17_17960 [Streptomyces rimosus]